MNTLYTFVRKCYYSTHLQHCSGLLLLEELAKCNSKTVKTSPELVVWGLGSHLKNLFVCGGVKKQSFLESFREIEIK